jgi:hypothetical protein
MLTTRTRFFRLMAWISVLLLPVSGGHAQLTGGAAVIAPGIGIGQVRIGERLDDVHRALGTPKLSDAAMGGKLLEVWRSGPAFEGRRQNGIEELEIYFRREGADLSGQAVARQIRVTSPFFRTASGISVRSSFAQVLAEFPGLLIDEELTYALSGGRSEKEVEMFVDRARGIAFEFRNGAAADPDAGGYCRAIHVFQPNTDPRAIQNFVRNVRRLIASRNLEDHLIPLALPFRSVEARRNTRKSRKGTIQKGCKYHLDRSRLDTSSLPLHKCPAGPIRSSYRINHPLQRV